MGSELPTLVDRAIAFGEPPLLSPLPVLWERDRVKRDFRLATPFRLLEDPHSNPFPEYRERGEMPNAMALPSLNESRWGHTPQFTSG